MSEEQLDWINSRWMIRRVVDKRDNVDTYDSDLTHANMSTAHRCLDYKLLSETHGLLSAVRVVDARFTKSGVEN